jgi:eukaryotic-like serine/threonine-protein kinase
MQSGHLLRNRYRIENRLFAGGFGETYIAVDEDYPDKRRVVVKHLKPQSNDPAVLDTARRLFDTEAVTLAKLGEKTDLIPTLYAYFEENKEFYLVQEFIEGQTLTQELGTRKLSEAETLKVVCEILTVLTEVHTNRIVHRDLKPDNIIRRLRDRKLVLIDFGAVKAVRQTTLNASNAKLSQSIGIGTDGYMPTEQAMGYPTSASDIYAVGAISLQCLTGKSPSELFDENDLVFKWQHLCSVSDRAVNILSKMVAARHLDRYANAMEAIKAIDLFVAPVAPVLMQTIPSPAPTPQPISQPPQATFPNPSPVTVKVPSKTPKLLTGRQIDRRNLIKWATLVGCVGFVVMVCIFFHPVLTVGLVAGMLAKILYPKNYNGFISTIILGIIGAFIGSSLWVLLSMGKFVVLSATSTMFIRCSILALLGSMVAIFIWGLLIKPR